MSSATFQGQLWGRRAQDFATYLEQTGLPLQAAALDAARVIPGTRLLDAGSARDSSPCLPISEALR